MTEIADAVRLHLLHCGFVDPDDNTVPIFTGNDPHFAWTSVDKLVDAMLARFDIQDPQRSPLPADETEWEYGYRFVDPANGTSVDLADNEIAARRAVRNWPHDPAEAVRRRPAGKWEVTQ